MAHSPKTQALTPAMETALTADPEQFATTDQGAQLQNSVMISAPEL